MWNLKYGTNEPNKETLTDIENTPVVAVGEVGVVEKNWEFENQTSKQRMDKYQGPIL